MNNFKKLISTIEQVHGQLQASAANAVNQALTVRNWLVGYYIVEFEQNGEDRAVYGDKLIEKLAGKLNHIKGIDERSLRRFRQFYLFYRHFEPTIRGTVTPELYQIPIRGTVSPELSESQIVGTLSTQFENQLVHALKREISKVIVGQTGMIDRLLIALLANIL